MEHQTERQNESNNEQLIMPDPTNKMITHKITNRKSLKQRKTKQQQHSPEFCINSNCYKCAKDNVVNLSNVELTKPQILLLSKGLSFVPTTKDSSPKEILNDFNSFTAKTKNKLRQLINPPRPPRPDDEPALFRAPPDSNKNMNTSIHLGPKPLEDAFEAMRLDISKLTLDNTKLKKHNNLTRKERLALKESSTNHQLIINKADKGSTIVVRHRSDYIHEGLIHLSDTKTYKKLDRDYTNDVAKHLRNTLE